jgi:dienelactone hydrolase
MSSSIPAWTIQQKPASGRRILTSLTPREDMQTVVTSIAFEPVRRRRSSLAAAVLAVLVAAAALDLGAAPAPAPVPNAQRVTFRSDDGVTLAATWYEPQSRPAPAVILVHMLQKSRRDWDQVATRMAGDGLGVLAVDLRGHGESQGGAQDYSAMVQDLRAARRFVATRADVTPAKVGLAGASMGATLAALAAADDAGFVSVALLSPTLEYRSLRIEPAVRKYGARPLLLVASDDDGYAARTVKELQKIGGGVREVFILPRAGHGTAMLGGDSELGQRLVDWFRRTLL